MSYVHEKFRMLPVNNKIYKYMVCPESNVSESTKNTLKSLPLLFRQTMYKTKTQHGGKIYRCITIIFIKLENMHTIFKQIESGRITVYQGYPAG